MNSLASLMAQGASGKGPGLDIGELVTKSGDLSTITQKMTESIAQAAGGTSSTPVKSPNTSGADFIPDYSPTPDTSSGSGSGTGQGVTTPVPPPPTFTPPSAPQVSPSTTDSAFTQLNKNFLNYSNMYLSPTVVNNNSQQPIEPQMLMPDYVDALLTGGGSQKIYSTDFESGRLPGNRYFIDTNTVCKDNNGDLHARSILIDNVNERTMDSFPNKERGLMYSLFASMGNIDVGHSAPVSAPAKGPSSAPTTSSAPSPSGISILTNSHIPNCKLAKVPNSDQPTAKTVQGYLTDKDFGEVDPTILENFATREGYATPLTDNMIGTIHKTHGSMVTHGNNVKNQVNSAKSASQSSISSIKANAKSKIKSYGSMQSSDLSDVSSAKKSADEKAAERIKPQYDKYYNTTKYPMKDLFPLFLNYNNLNAITPLCIYATLDKVANVPNSISNYYANNSTGNNCHKSQYSYQYPTLEPGKFIDALKKYATYNYYYKDADKFEIIPESTGIKEGNLVNINNEYVPPKTTCQLVKVKIANIIAEFAYDQDTYNWDACMNIVNPNFNTFWDALEEYRDPIIKAFMTTDYPQYFGYCPPSIAPPSQAMVPSNVGQYENFNETFQPMKYGQVISRNNETQLYFLLILLIVIVLCLFFLIR